MPSDNLDFHTLSLKLGRDLPRDPSLPKSKGEAEAWRKDRLPRLRSIVKPVVGVVGSEKVREAESGGVKATSWRIKVGTSWTVPAVELTRGESKGTTILLGDEGREKLSARCQGPA